MSKKRCCCGKAPVAPVANPICAIILLIILQRTCLLENKNAFLLILLFLGFCFCCRRPAVAGVAGCGGGY